jgi:methyl-accepting chemotaxis protein
MKIRQQLALLVIACLSGIGLVVSVSLAVMSTVSIGSDNHARMQKNQSLLADLLPPPLFLVEAHLIFMELEKSTTSQMAIGQTQDLANQLHKLAQNYHSTCIQWKQEPIADTLNKIVQEICRDDSSFTILADSIMIPAALAKDSAMLAEAGEIMDQIYMRNEGYIRNFAPYLNQFVEKDIQDARTTGKRTILITILLALCLGLGLGWFGRKLIRSITGPLKEVVDAAGELARGNTSVTLSESRKDELGELARAMNGVSTAVHSLVTQAGGLSRSAIEGRLQDRMQADSHQGDFQVLANGINGLLNSLVGHLDSLPLPVMLVGNDLRILYANEALAALVGEPAQTLLGASCHEKLSTSDCGTEGCTSRCAMGSGKSCSSQGQASILGKTLHLTYTSRPIHDLGGQVIGAMEVFVDQTAMVQSQDREREIAKAQSDLDNKRGGFQAQEIERLGAALDELVEGHLVFNLTPPDGDPDTADISSAFSVLHRSISSMVRNLCSSFRDIRSYTETLAASSVELASVSHQLGGTSEETTQMAANVAVNTNLVSENVRSVATATEEMSSTLREIARNTAEAVTVARVAVDAADKANAQILRLGHSGEEIGEVVKVITSIAQQTNLLALNATIEAARAGEFGKGFAVVAGEVKELAKQTAQATREIGQRITAIQQDTTGSVEAIDRIQTVIRTIHDLQTSVAAAIEEQTATTQEIAINVTSAAQSTGEINQGVTAVAEAARSTSIGAEETQKAAGQLARMASELQFQVERFRLD